MKEERNSNIEFLRIIVMLLIIMHHYVLHGVLETANMPLSFNKIFLNTISIGGKLGVNIFILITGYYSIKNTNNNYKKIMCVYIKIFLYSLIIPIVFFLIKGTDISIFEMITPIFSETWWFATYFFVLLIFIPFLNQLIAVLSQKKYISLLIINTVLFSAIPTIFGYSMQPDVLIWFIFLYLLGAYLKQYPEQFQNQKYNLIYFLSSLIFIFVSLFINFPSNEGFPYFANGSKLPMLMLSVSLFLLFANKKCYRSHLFNRIAATTFGIYLIHDHPLVRNFLWKEFFNNSLINSSSSLIISVFFSILFVFAICSIIDFLMTIGIINPIMKIFKFKKEKNE